MSKDKRHINYDFREAIQYLKNLLSGKDRNRIERKLEKDLFEKEAMEGFESIPTEQLEQDIKELSHSINIRSKKKNHFFTYKIAAGIAAIIVLSFGFYFVFDKQIDDIPKAFNVSENINEEVKKEQKLPEPKEKKAEIKEKSNAPLKKKLSGTATPSKEKQEKVSNSIDEKKSIQENSIVFESDKDEDEINPLEKEIIQEFDVVENVEVSISQEYDIEESSPPAAARETINFIEENEKAERIATQQAQPVLSTSRKAMASKKSMPAMANQVSGIIISGEDNEPITGVSVIEKGSENGVITDTQGHFELTLKNKESTLIASFIGMNSQEVSTSEKNEVNIVLQSDMISLDEVVVVGYGRESGKEQIENRSVLDENDLNLDTNYIYACPENGFTAFKNHIEENMIFPREEENTNRAIVILKFFLDPTGHPKKIRVVKSPGESFSNEAIRLLKSGPQWNPAQRNGESLNEEIRLRIIFNR